MTGPTAHLVPVRAIYKLINLDGPEKHSLPCGHVSIWHYINQTKCRQLAALHPTLTRQDATVSYREDSKQRADKQESHNAPSVWGPL